MSLSSLVHDCELLEAEAVDSSHMEFLSWPLCNLFFICPTVEAVLVTWVVTTVTIFWEGRVGSVSEFANSMPRFDSNEFFFLMEEKLFRSVFERCRKPLLDFFFLSNSEDADEELDDEESSLLSVCLLPSSEKDAS